MRKKHTPKGAPIKVVAGKPIDQYPSPDEIKDLLRHFYHHTGEAGLEVLLAELGKVELILIYRHAVNILNQWDKLELPDASGCKEVAHG